MAKAVVAAESVAAPEGGRRLKSRKEKRQELRHQVKQARAGAPALPSAFQLFKTAARTLGRHWKLFGGMLLFYIVLVLALAQSVANLSNVPAVKQVLETTSSGPGNHLVTGVSLFAYLLGTAATNGGIVNVYQPILSIVVSLAIIWTLRQLQAGRAVRLRDGFYHGMFPLIPFVLVLVVIGLQLLPMGLGASLYSIATNSGVSASLIEQVLFGGVFAALAGLSLFWLSSSLFALYIVCLPDMTPLRALRAARDLVRFRRWTVLRKLLFLPASLVVLAAVVVIPLLIFATPLAGWAFFVLSMAAIALIHSYMYTLYRSLL